ncbi:MAG: CBS domain-containing protein [bacterium]|nr:CBS domain-containing protein [bacterium]MDZ4342296.1 CBS domain-containing protein [Candidatus Binatia bacterium]
MKVNEIITRDPEVIRPDAVLIAAAQKMNSLDIGVLPVCDGDRLVGMITDRDIAVRGVAQGYDPKTARVQEVMTPEVIYCFDDEDVKEAAKKMEEKQVRRLPVLNREKRLVGIVSLGDLAVRTDKEKLAGEVLERVSEPGHSRS